MTKAFSGLQFVEATRISIANCNPNENSISVNGRKLSYKEVDTGVLRITENGAYTLDEADGVYYKVLNTNSEIVVKSEEEVQPGKLAAGQIIPAGSSLFKQQSPAPIAYIDRSGRLGSANLWTNIFVENVMGFVDIDKAENTYNHGLVPAGSDVHEGLFLRKDGQWGQPSVWTGSVSESFLSLQDTPTSYTSNIDKYLRVSYEEGGSVVFDEISTGKVPESENLYYTDERVNTRITDKLLDKSIANISVSGTISANEVLAESDRRLKSNIRQLDSDMCLEMINEIDPQSYRFKSHPKTRYGVIAQQLETILPNLVSYNTAGFAAVNYLELIPFLIGSVKSLTDQVNCLKYDLEILSKTKV
jgi:hypothetical protein